MLLWFWNKIQEAYDAEDRSKLAVQLGRGGIAWAGIPMDVTVWLPVGPDEPDPNVHSREVRISEEIPELSRGAEAVAVFDRLVRGGYVAATVDPSGLGSFYDLTDKGRVDIGKFPEPGQKLAAALEAVLVSIEQDTSTTDEQRRSRLSAVVQTVTLLNTMPELGQKAANALERLAGG